MQASLLFVLSCLSFFLQGVFARPWPISDPSLSKRDSSGAIQFKVDLTYESINTVGAEKTTILVNGTSPGPVLHMTIGDTVEFKVNNYLPFSTSVHFHGITQLGTPWSDGVPGVSQVPIASGATFVYEWTADEAGTYFYHAHHKGQIDDGLYGAIVIDPAPGTSNPFSMISTDSTDLASMEMAELNPSPLLVADWSRQTFDQIYSIEQASGFDDLCPDTVIINGKGSVQCPGTDYINQFVLPATQGLLKGTSYTAKGCLPLPLLPSFIGPFPVNQAALPSYIFDDCTATTGSTEIITVDPADGWASINIISTAGTDTLEVSIDEHPMYIYAADGAYIEPQLVEAVVVPNGNRYQAMIKLDKPIGDYTIRVAVVGLNQIASGFAVLSYKGSTCSTPSNNPYINYAGQNVSADVVFFSDAQVVPFEPVAPGDATSTYFMNITNEGLMYLWTLSGLESYSEALEQEQPLLFDPTQAEAMNTNLTITTELGQWVDIVLPNPGPIAPPHPIHKHSNKAFIIGSGQGIFPWNSVAEAAQEIPENFNFVNPQQRDGFTTPPALGQPAWMAIRYQVINPGAFIIHCHIQAHFSGGMAVAILDAPSDFPPIPQQYLDSSF